VPSGYKNLKGAYAFNKFQNFINPNTHDRYRGFNRDLREFQRVVLEILKMIVWNPQYSNFATFNPHASEVWLNLIRENLDREQLYLAPRIHLLFRRLFSERKLQSYVNPSRHIFFNLQLFNPRIHIDPHNFQRVFEYRSIPTQRVPNPVIYQFRDSFPAYCIIQELNLERQEIVYYWYYTRDFISEEIRNSNDFESREYDFFIMPLLQYLWSTRLTLSSLTGQYLEDFFIEHLSPEQFSDKA